MAGRCLIVGLVLLPAILLPPAAAATGSLAVVSSASYTAPLASQAIASAFGSDLAITTAGATLPLPTSLDGTSVNVTDSASVTRPAPLFYISPAQVNFQIPAQTAIGTATVSVTSGDGAVSTSTVQITAVAPGFFPPTAMDRAWPRRSPSIYSPTERKHPCQSTRAARRR